MRKIIILAAMVVLLIMQTLSIQGYAVGSHSDTQNQIVFVADLSGSMEQTDNDQYMKDALKLGVDLAPYDAQVALVMVSDKVVMETDLMKTGTQTDRAQLKTSIDQIIYKGNTNFGAGLYKALEILESASEKNGMKRIVFLGDFAEGGYTKLRTPAAQDKEIDALKEFAAKAKNQNICIDLIFVREPPDDSLISPFILDLPKKTGGQLFQLPDAADFPKAIHNIFFSSFAYLQSSAPVGTVAGEKIMDISMPTDYVNRARIYIAASNPATNVKASYADASLDGEFNRSYSMIHLNRPAREGVSLRLNPGTSGTVDIYLLLDYTLQLSVSVANEMILVEEEKISRQLTTLIAEIRDTQTGQPLLSAPFPKEFSYSIQLLGPDGEKIELERNLDNPYQYTFFPQSYGNYSVTAQLTIGDVVIGVPPDSAAIEDIRPVEEPTNWPLIIAISVVCLFILSAIIIALRIKKKEAVFQGAVEMTSDYRFHGKLSIYAVMLEGGNRELRPFDFRLHTLWKCQIWFSRQ